MLLRQYLALIRLPNVFTAPPNVIAGYFVAVAPADANSAHLAALMISSGLLYIAGTVLNDYFDVDTDKKERPSRPLASGSIKKGHAIVIALTAIAAANIITLVAVNLTSFVVSAALSTVIVAYDRFLKRGAISGPIAMGSARSLNVILGASPALPIVLSNNAAILSSNFQTLTLIAASLFVYILAIMVLSKREVAGSTRQHRVAAFSMVFAVIVSVGISGYMLQLQLAFLLNLSIFAAVMIYTFKLYPATAAPTQKVIRNMIISIVILDSVFVSGTAGIFYGMATLLFIVPAAVLAKKMYVT